MTKNIGKTIVVGFGRETTRATAVAINIRMPKATLDMEDKSDKILDTSAIGIIEEAFAGHTVKQWAEGNFDANLYANSIGFLLYALFGALTTTGSGPNYSHAFTVAQSNQHQSLTMGIADNNQDRTFALAMIDTFEIKTGLQEFVTISAAIKSLKSADATLTPSFGTDYPLLAKHTKVKIAANVAGLGAASFISVRSFSLKFNKNLEEDGVLGSTEPADFCNTVFEVEGDIELIFTDDTYKDFYFDNTQKAMLIQIEDTSTVITGSIYPKLSLTLAKVVFTEYGKIQDNENLVKQGLTFKALYSTGDTSMISATLVNSKVSY